MLALALMAYAAAIAWTHEDANITLRVIENALNGYGLRWNPDERVQAYTHPLWMLAQIPIAGMLLPFIPAQPDQPAYEALYAAHLVLSMLCMGGMLALLLWHFRRTPLLFAGFIFLPFAASPALMDYASSGLENPMAFCFITLLVWAFYQPENPRIWFLRSLFCSLLIMTRMDQLLLFAPIFAATLWPLRRQLPWRALLIGAQPLLLWCTFALVYYGFIMPNTYYAKLSATFPLSTYLESGLRYLLDFARFAPVSAAVYMLLAGWMSAALPQWRSHRRLLALGAGVFLHAAYVVYVGGDYMSGRLFTFSCCMAVVVMAFEAGFVLPQLRHSALAALLVATAFAQPWLPHTLLHFTEYEYMYNERMGRIYTCFFCPEKIEPPEQSWAQEGLAERQDKINNYPGIKYVVTRGNIGINALFAGPEIYGIDTGRLADAFLARLPVNWEFRIGHFYTDVPPGYYEARAEDDLSKMQPDLAEYYEKLHSIIAGPIWSWQRWKNIIAFNL
ncbi:MAG: hypothetical protein EBV03_07870, partial [Proteobacteria bacterium]|nr:hypothetical protein [Pseudomonadota bacterium]